MAGKGYVGRSVLFEYSLQAKTTAEADLVFTKFGMFRSLELNVNWDTVDATGSDSADFTKENLVTFKEVTMSGDYVAQLDDVENHGAFEDHVLNPPAETNYQPEAWLRLTYPNGRVVTGIFIVNENNASSPYADVVTGTFSAMSNGAVTSIRTAP